MKKHLFITGMGRSGTTLIDKIFESFAEVGSFSQPLPLLLVQIKADFLKSMGMDDNRFKYPLSDQQFENIFDSEVFINFLENYHLSKDYIENILGRMAAYSGQTYKPENLLESTQEWKDDYLVNFVKHYFDTHNLNRKSNSIAWKEIVAEEFVPYLLKNNFRVLLIIRDPRDVITSMIKSEGEIYSGSPRPLLWMIRQWRKSVAYKHQYETNNLVKVIQYENLVSTPDIHIENWKKWMQIDESEELSDLKDQNGKTWLGNSSFQTFNGISTNSIGSHKKLLSSVMQAFIEALCFAEMKAMGYEISINIDDVEEIIRKGSVEDYLERKVLAHYSYSQQRCNEELMRWRSLTASEALYNPSEFIFEHNFEKLHQIIKLKNS